MAELLLPKQIARVRFPSVPQRVGAETLAIRVLKLTSLPPTRRHWAIELLPECPFSVRGTTWALSAHANRP